MQAISTDIENELAEIAREADLLARALELYTVSFREDEAWHWLAIQGIASAVEKIYTGCERVMALIADVVDGARIEHSEGWHGRLLRRIAYPYPERRRAVISQRCFDSLDQLRSFRHRERNSYGLSLDSEIVLERARFAGGAFQLFKSEVASFVRELD